MHGVNMSILHLCIFVPCASPKFRVSSFVVRRQPSRDVSKNKCEQRPVAVPASFNIYAPEAFIAQKRCHPNGMVSINDKTLGGRFNLSPFSLVPAVLSRFLEWVPLKSDEAPPPPARPGEPFS